MRVEPARELERAGALTRGLFEHATHDAGRRSPRKREEVYLRKLPPSALGGRGLRLVGTVLGRLPASCPQPTSPLLRASPSRASSSRGDQHPNMFGLGHSSRRCACAGDLAATRPEAAQRPELAFGAQNSRRVAENLDRLQRFCSAFQSFDFDGAAADHYGSVRALLSREGRSIGSNDLLIAAIALSKRAQLVTRNVGEFSRVPGLDVEAW